MTFLLIIMLIRLLILLAEMLAKEFRDRKINYNFKINTTMFRRFIPNRIVNWERLFEDHFVNVKVLFAMRFNAIPSITYIGELEITKAFSFLKERYRNEVLYILQHSYFDHDKGELFCNNTVFVSPAWRLNGKRLRLKGWFIGRADAGVKLPVL